MHVAVGVWLKSLSRRDVTLYELWRDVMGITQPLA